MRGGSPGIARGTAEAATAQQCGLLRTFIGSVERGERNVSLLNLRLMTGNDRGFPTPRAVWAPVGSSFRPAVGMATIAAMHLLAYWRWDNYVRDLDAGAGFHFNSKQSRLHSAIGMGETLWLFTAVKAPPRYFLVAKLVVRSKTLNAPGDRYGKYRVWGDLRRSRYFRVRPDVPEDEAFELLRGLRLVSGSLAKTTRGTLPQGCQTIRGVTPSGQVLLDSFAQALATEERASRVVDEYTLERALAADEPSELEELLRRQHTGASAGRIESLLAGVRRDRRLVREMHELYEGKCQVCAFNSLAAYGVPSAEAQHLVDRSRGGGADSRDSVVLLCPTHHAVVHRADATFDHGRLTFLFPNRRAEPLCLNRHLKRRA
jgi:hypothetical protein